MARDRSAMPRYAVWLQLLIGWLPIWALYATMIATAHREVALGSAAMVAFRTIAMAALVGTLVDRLTQRLPWPRPVRLSFVLTHLVAAACYALLWLGAASLLESVLRRQLVIVSGPTGIAPFLIIGGWLYVMVAGVSYATRASNRAALAEAAAARAELAALRAHLNPHFLFNTLHTVVQLIPKAPAQAAAAAEELAGLLRSTLEQDRDLVPLREELDLVDRYLGLERVRFGDRLRIERRISAEAAEAELPSFAVQTLVENAVRHGAAPKIEPTEITIAGALEGESLVVTVTDTGVGSAAAAPTPGTGLKRLRDRLLVLYGTRATFTTEATPTGFQARLVVPWSSGSE